MINHSIRASYYNHFYPKEPTILLKKEHIEMSFNYLHVFGQIDPYLTFAV